MIALYAAAILAGLLLAWFAAVPRPFLTVVTFGVFLALAFAAFVEASGRPRPAQVEWRRLSDVQVLAYSLDEPHAIYLWLMLGEPTGYRMPWSMKSAKQLVAADAEAGQRGRRLMMRRLESTPDDDSVVFHAPPQKPPPPKTIE